MSNSYSITTSEILNSTRTPDEIELESATHFLTMFFMNNPQCSHELDAFYVSQDAMRALAGGNPEVETYLLLTDVKQWIRTLTGHSWSN